MSQNSQPNALCLAHCRQEDPGHALGLLTGDVLIGLAGIPWSGTPDALALRAAGRSVLTFRRGDAVWSVIADRLDLGRWEKTTLPPSMIAFEPFDPDRLCNWEIVADAQGIHDLFPLRPSLLALLAPALWLAQRRLWTLLATLVAGIALALPAGGLGVLAFWVAAGLHLWRNGTDHIRADRAAAGFHRVGLVAARTEVKAVSVWIARQPNAQFLFEAGSDQGFGAVG